VKSRGLRRQTTHGRDVQRSVGTVWRSVGNFWIGTRKYGGVLFTGWDEQGNPRWEHMVEELPGTVMNLDKVRQQRQSITPIKVVQIRTN
jgi:hypothetical protein